MAGPHGRIDGSLVLLSVSLARAATVEEAERKSSQLRGRRVFQAGVRRAAALWRGELGVSPKNKLPFFSVGRARPS